MALSMTWVENSVIKRMKPDMISSSSVMAWQEKKLGPVWFCLQMPIFLYLFVWLLVLNTCGAIRQEKKIRTLIHWNTFKSMKSVGLYFSLCFASDSCYCNISYATVITHDFKRSWYPISCCSTSQYHCKVKGMLKWIINY